MENIRIKQKGGRRPISALQHILNNISPGEAVIVTDAGTSYEKASSKMKARCTNARLASGYTYSYRTLNRNAIGAMFEISCKH